MRPLAFDFETSLIQPALLAPPPACLTWQRPGQEARICAGDEMRSRFRDWLADQETLFIGANTAFDMAVAAEAWPEIRPAIFKAYDEDRVTDVQICDRLLNIARGVYLGRFGKFGVFVKHTYDLASLAKRVAGIELQKDEWRLSYGEFIGVPLAEWPRRAVEVQQKASDTQASLLDEWYGVSPKDIPKEVTKRIEGLRSMIASDPSRCTEYPLDDARATLAVWEKHQAHTTYLADQFRQARAYFAAHLGSAWGLRTDAASIDILQNETEEYYLRVKAELEGKGLVDASGKKNTKVAKRLMLDVCAREGIAISRTDGHEKEGKCKTLAGVKLPDGDDACEDHVCLDEDACLSTGDETLASYAEFSTLKKVLSNDVNALRGGSVYPTHTRYGLAESGRFTSSKQGKDSSLRDYSTNIQNIRRMPGIREAFVPRAGCVFVQADYPQLESYTWAQFCLERLGQSRLAEALNAGLDNHLILTGILLDLDYEVVESRYLAGDPEIDDLRQLSKIGNYGNPGGMGPDTMLESARKQLKPEVFKRLGLDRDRMVKLRDAWKQAWPEAQVYLDYIRSLGPEYPRKFSATVESLYTKRFRGGVTYCSACNNGFQALGADCTKNAWWLITYAQYAKPESPLFNSRSPACIHDEFILEAADTPRAHDTAYALRDCMVDGANVFLPDVPIPRDKVKPCLMRRWSKKAKPVFDANGRLVPWE